MQSSKALEFPYSCTLTDICCYWCIKAINDKLEGVLGLSKPWLCYRLSWDVQHGISLVNCPFTGRDEVAFLLTMPIRIWRQGWSDLSGQRHKGHPFPGMAPSKWEQGENHLALVGAGNSTYSWSLLLCPPGKHRAMPGWWQAAAGKAQRCKHCSSPASCCVLYLVAAAIFILKLISC